MLHLPDFNPHTREGCDPVLVFPPLVKLVISIHTPVKGVTVVLISESYPTWISIHTPVKGVT